MNQLKQAATEYFKTAEEILEWLREQPSVEIPTEFRLLAPEAQTTAGGEIFSYQLPAAAQLDESIMPHAFLGNDLMVLAYFPNRSKTYASEHRTNWRVPLDSEHPASAAIYFDVNEFVDAANAWLRYVLEIQQSAGLTFELKNEAENDLLDFEQEELIQTWDRLVDFLKCFRGVSMLRYSEDDATVAHFIVRIEDIPK